MLVTSPPILFTYSSRKLPGHPDLIAKYSYTGRQHIPCSSTLYCNIHGCQQRDTGAVSKQDSAATYYQSYRWLKSHILKTQENRSSNWYQMWTKITLGNKDFPLSNYKSEIGQLTREITNQFWIPFSRWY